MASEMTYSEGELEQDELPLMEADSGDTDSDYGSSVESDTTSLTSTVIDYVYENGRRYHRLSEGKYAMPNDEIEQDRLDLYHHLQLILLGGRLYLAPITDNIHRVLDSGTGTGIWALDFAETLPSAEIIGTDLSPIQPSWTYPNCHFQIADMEDPWTFPPNHFDFIHSRALMNSIRDWPAYLSHCYSHLQPGGYLEIGETEMDIHSDDNTKTGSHLAQHMADFITASEKAGLVYPNGAALKARVEGAGFVDVKLYTFKQPWGAWPKGPQKRIGAIVGAVLETAFAAYGLGVLTRFGGYSVEEALESCRLAMEDVNGKKVHCYSHLWHVVGRKPGLEELAEMEERKRMEGEYDSNR